MSYRLKRVGPWIFAILIGWYITGSVVSNHLRERNKILQQNQHKNTLTFDGGANAALLVQYINTNDKNSARINVKLVFNPRITQITVVNSNLWLDVTGKPLGDKFVLAISKIKPRPRGSSTDVVIQLPPGINTVEFSDIPDVGVMGNFNDQGAGLNLVIANGKTDVDIEKLNAHHLILTSTNQPASTDCKCSASFDIEKDSNITKLDVSMQHGSFTFGAKKIPEQSRLAVADGVKIEAPAIFLKSAILEQIAP